MEKSTTARDAGRQTRVDGFWIYLGIALLAACLLSVYFLARGKAFTFYDFGSDTLYCFYPIQFAVAQQLKTLHTVTWSFDLGLGGFIGSWFDPLWLVTGWLPNSWQLSLRLVMFLARLLLGGGFFYGYLRQVGIREPVAVIGGLGYAFSSCGLINAQWEVMQGTEFVQFAAYLYLLEHFMRNRRPWAGVAAGAVVGLGHPLGLYTYALFSLVYATARLGIMGSGQRARVVLAMLTFAGWCVVGVALMAPLLLPALYYLFDSPRAQAELFSLHTLFSLNDAWTISSEFAGLLGKDLLGTGVRYAGWQNYFEGPGFYTGLLPLLCIPQLLGPLATRRERRFFFVGIIGVLLYFLCPALRYAVYAYGHEAFRFSTYWISVLLLVLGLAGLQRALLSGWWRPGIAIGASVILAIVLGTILTVPASVNVEHAARVVAFTMLYAAFAALNAGPSDKSPAKPYVLVAICACELLTFALPAVIERDAVAADGSSPAGRYDDSTVQALALVRQNDHDGNFFRIEKTYSSVFLDDALVQGYSGTASYYYHASGLSRFVDSLHLPRVWGHPNYIGSMATRPKILDLLAVKYVLTRDRNLASLAGMTSIGRAGDVEIFKSDSAHSFATFYDSIRSESQADSLTLPERDNLLLATAIVDNPTDVDAKLTGLRALPSAPDVQRETNIRKKRDDELRGEVATPSASLLLLAMPFDRGWSATVDAKELDLFRADYGLTAALIPAGRHTIALDYVPPGRKFGFSLMAGALTFLTVLRLFSGDSSRYAGWPGRTGRRSRHARDIYPSTAASAA